MREDHRGGKWKRGTGDRGVNMVDKQYIREGEDRNEEQQTRQQGDTWYMHMNKSGSWINVVKIRRGALERKTEAGRTKL